MPGVNEYLNVITFPSDAEDIEQLHNSLRSRFTEVQKIYFHNTAETKQQGEFSNSFESRVLCKNLKTETGLRSN